MESNITNYLSPGIGKERHVRAWLLENPQPRHRGVASGKEIVHTISRKDIESLDVNNFLEFCGPHIGIEALRGIQGNVHFAISGYDDTSEELYEISDVRDYFKVLNFRYPAWLFAASTKSPSLLAVLFLSCDTLEIARNESKLVVEVGVRCKKRFLLKSYPAMLLLNYITKTLDVDAENRMEAVNQYLAIN